MPVETERIKVISAAINKWLSDDRGADYDDLARLIDSDLRNLDIAETIDNPNAFPIRNNAT